MNEVDGTPRIPRPSLNPDGTPFDPQPSVLNPFVKRYLQPFVNPDGTACNPQPLVVQRFYQLPLVLNPNGTEYCPRPNPNITGYYPQPSVVNQEIRGYFSQPSVVNPDKTPGLSSMDRLESPTGSHTGSLILVGTRKRARSESPTELSVMTEVRKRNPD